jgi:parallel beta helix pectate lyase-like protein
MYWRPRGTEQAFPNGHDRSALFWTSLGIAVFFLALIYIAKYVSAVRFVNRGPCSSDCTVYASPSGNDQNSGKSPSTPKTFLGAAAASQPGSIVCLLAGTYFLSSPFIPPASGNPSAWIVYKSCDGGAVNLVWTGDADASPMFKLGNGKFPSGPAYLEFRGLHLDGRGNAADGFFCRGGHHLRFISNSITNTGGSGIGSIACDYLTVDHNVIYHNGRVPPGTKVPQWYSWTSGISFNSNQWFDTFPGFHNIISSNIVADEVDQSSKHTDGNGIILDLSNRTEEYSSANTPPALVINNVVYANGGRCIEAYTVTNFWFVNNTCYKNVLDLPKTDEASVSVINSHDGYVINDLAVAWRSSDPCYAEEKTTQNINFFSNLCFQGSSASPSSGRAEFMWADPLLVAPLDLPPALAVQHADLPAPHLLGERLMLMPGSPALGRGVDPSTLPGLPAEIVGDLKKYIYMDYNGRPRPRGGPFDLGAYQTSPIERKSMDPRKAGN